jgi:gamma-glutamyltranspeptidase / glutathione hydrolase
MGPLVGALQAGDVTMSEWYRRAAVEFETEKTPVTASRGMVVANHPLASAAGMEMLAAGGNAVDAAIAALFAVTVVEPAMVGIVGGGTALLRLAEGREIVLDGMATAPLAARRDSFQSLSTEWPLSQETTGRKNRVGVQSVAVPGNLKAWCEAVERFGKLSLEEVLAPAIRHAERGFILSPYLATDIASRLPDILRDPGITALLAPGGEPLRAGERLVQGDYAATLRGVAREGAGFLHGGEFGRAIANHMRENDGFLTMADLEGYTVIDRDPIRVDYRGFEIVGVPPPCSGGACVAEILNILEGYDIAGPGYGAAATTHLLLEALKCATVDRDEAVGDPAFIDAPTAHMISKEYAALRRQEIDPQRASLISAGLHSVESANTTHVTTADAEGNVVTSTQTINSTLGACVVVPGTGALLNNYMYVFNPNPGHATSIAPGKRITGNIAATIVKRDGRLVYALGLPGGFKIPSVVAQAVVNLIDHGMSLQQAVEAPRVFAKGPMAEIENGFGRALIEAMSARGHPAKGVDSIAGCMAAIAFEPDGRMTGASCWRGDGSPVGIGGGRAREGVVFWPDPSPRQ